MTDTYLTITSPAEGQYTEKRSRFLAFAFPVCDEDEVKERLALLRQKYYDARHVCYAYMLGPERLRFRSNDDGEPSGTAGKPILGQINSAGLTNVLVAVVRYFGGIKLGTSGLLQAYRAAAAEALGAATVEERYVMTTLQVSFPYTLTNQVMRILHDADAHILRQDYADNCTVTLSIRDGMADTLQQRLTAVYGVTVDL